MVKLSVGCFGVLPLLSGCRDTAAHQAGRMESKMDSIQVHLGVVAVAVGRRDRQTRQIDRHPLKILVLQLFQVKANLIKQFS